MKINIQTSHPSAFISSTFADLQAERLAVANMLRENGLNVNALDIKPASTNSSKQEIIAGIKESDFIILIIGDRFGSILKSMTGNLNSSITQWEYKIAKSMKRPVVAFFKQFDEAHPIGHDDINASDYKKKRQIFEPFKKTVADAHNPAYFKDSAELASKVRAALIPTYRNVARAVLGQGESYEKRIAELEAEVSLLKSQQVNRRDSGNILGGLGVK
mgnify:CR=1 FL=1